MNKKWKTLAVGICFLVGAGKTNATSYFTAVGNSVTSYDFNLSGGITHVAYESGGNIYYTEQTFDSNSWSAPQLIGAGTGPSIAFQAGTAYVSFINGGTLNVSSYSGSWSSTDLGTGAETANIRTDSAGTIHLFSSVTSGYGSINYTQNLGNGWAANTNLATGWYGSGSGNYYHQAVMTTGANAVGYQFIYDFQNWGGRVSWSSESIETSGLSGWPSPGVGWNSGTIIGAGGLSIAANGNIMAGYMNGGIGYVQSYNGAVWSGVSLGSATNVSVFCDASGGNIVNYVSSGLLYQSLDGGTTSQNVTISGTNAAGSQPLYQYLDSERSQLFYIDSATGSLMSYSVPEPSAIWLVLLAAGAFFSRRPLWRQGRLVA